MRNWVVGVMGVGAALFASSAQADGLYRTNTGLAGADFSGVEVGLNLGLGIGSGGAVNTSGLAGGAHAGYNLQNGPIVGGVEGDIVFGSISGGSNGYGSFSQSSLESFRGRAGYAFGDILGYGTIGWAWSTSSYENFSGSSGNTLSGYVLGVGAEYALTKTVTARAELRRYNFGDATYYLPNGRISTTPETNMLLLGVSTHF